MLDKSLPHVFADGVTSVQWHKQLGAHYGADDTGRAIDAGRRQNRHLPALF